MGPRDAQLLAVLLVLGLCALAGGEKPSACQCSRLSPQSRKNCGFPGITSDECFDKGCCFDSSVVGVPWCFEPLPKQESEQCVMEVSDRKDCGYPGISSEECTSRNCCFSNLIFEVPWCFFPKSVEGNVAVGRAVWFLDTMIPPLSLEVGCGEGSCLAASTPSRPGPLPPIGF
ncbi:hypothetical protein H8957_009640 [Semnopithecus entellus]